MGTLAIINRFRVHVMVHHAMFSHLLVFRSRFAVVGVRVDGDTAARGEFAPDFNEARVH